MNIATIQTEFKVGVDKVDSLNSANFLPEEIDVLLNTEQSKYVEQRAYGNNPRRQGLEETQKRLDDLKNITQNYSSSTFIQNSDNKPGGYFVNLPSDYRHAIEEQLLLAYVSCDDTIVTSGNITSGTNYIILSGTIVYNGTTYTGPTTFIGVTLNNNVVKTFTGTGTVYTASQKRSKVIPRTHDRYNKTVEDPFNKTNNEQINRLGFGKINGIDAFEIITDDTFVPITYYLRYLRNPNEMQYGTVYAVPTTNVDCELADYATREIIAMTVANALRTIEANNRYITANQELNKLE